MRRGANDFGESGWGERERSSEPERCLLRSLGSLIVLPTSELSSIIGASIHATKDPPYVFCLHLPPALKDLSCRGGLPGMVAIQC